MGFERALAIDNYSGPMKDGTWLAIHTRPWRPLESPHAITQPWRSLARRVCLFRARPRPCSHAHRETEQARQGWEHQLPRTAGVTWSLSKMEERQMWRARSETPILKALTALDGSNAHGDMGQTFTIPVAAGHSTSNGEDCKTWLPAVSETEHYM